MIEDATAILPAVIAQSVCMEAAHFLRDDAPVQFEDALASRAEHLFTVNGDFAKKIRSAAGRDYLYMFMRHWLAGSLKKHHVGLYRRLPARFANGGALS